MKVKVLLLLFALLAVSCSQVVGDGGLRSYHRANIHVSLKHFGKLTKSMVGTMKSWFINKVLSGVNEEHHGAKNEGDGKEVVKVTLFLSEDKGHLVVRANKRPLLTMKTERYARESKTTTTLFMMEKKPFEDKHGNPIPTKLCMEMSAPLPDTPSKMWHAILDLGIGGGSNGGRFDNTCSEQKDKKSCKKFAVCKSKKRLFRKRKCVPKEEWGSDKVFKKCRSAERAEECFETRVGKNMDATLMEKSFHLDPRSKGGELESRLLFAVDQTVKNAKDNKKLHRQFDQIMDGVKSEREKLMFTDSGGKLKMHSFIHNPEDESFDYLHTGKDIYFGSWKILFNTISRFSPIKVHECHAHEEERMEKETDNDFKFSLLETKEKELAQSKALMTLAQQAESLTEAELHTEKGHMVMKGIGSFLIGATAGLMLGAVVFLGVLMIIKTLIVIIIPLMLLGGLAVMASML